MPNEDIIRAWKDEEYRNSLSEEQRSQLPENPVGIIDISDMEMETVAGGGLCTCEYPSCGIASSLTCTEEPCCSISVIGSPEESSTTFDKVNSLPQSVTFKA
ncbi:MAG: mersacidin/lichenicidin family type 2 lantibiotic [Scytonema sp. PMC 1069.18]|nr:mersacidin/lichenicidin family type 2 lantibiotic [Scytonema sp. PMC 1069.18]MEC4882294.1 mersacidin/lichenicidin family type 2 lantibiotic [Scytonema sp. PMC 1070.18]